jgi:hypothetical protein
LRVVAGAAGNSSAWATGAKPRSNVDSTKEDFDRGRRIRGNKTTVIARSGDARIAIFAGVSTGLSVSPIFRCAP